MSRSERRAARIRSDVPIEQVLASCGFDVVVAGGSREQQFRCTLHGDGTDNKPSARCYPENNSWYCWACQRSRDAIQTVREREGLTFYAALDRLEKHFGLPSLPWEDSDREDAPTDPLAGAFDAPLWSFEDEARRVGRLVGALCAERTRSLAVVLAIVEDYDRLIHQSEIHEDEAFQGMERLRGRIKSVLGAA